MRLSYDWLSDFVDLSGLSPEEVAEKLTMGAFEVEEIKRIGADIRGQVVVGEILEILPHPDPEATKIRMTRTRVQPDAEPLEIICGAWNIEPGQRIPVALPGSIVINRKTGEPLPIERGKIRGAVSNGMLCSAPELGIAGSGEGILILDPSAPIGKDARELLGIKQDAVLHVEPRSNRGDALCVLGLAREVAALCGRPLKQPRWQLPDAEETGTLSVHIENEDDCPYFTVRLLNGVKVGPSPSWMVRRLEAVGMRSVNNVVDVTNYVLQELGQPLHGYDMRRLHGDHLEVRRARAGERLLTLDDKERELSNEVMVIADKQGVVGVAGVMGGKGSEISDDTTMVALEAAAFNMKRVRRSSRILGLSSDSSLRFERGVDLAGVRHASDRAAYLMIEHCGARLGRFNASGTDAVRPLFVSLRLSEVERLTELKLSTEEVVKLLSPLGFTCANEGSTAVKVNVPPFRMRDVTREADLVEEVTRLYGYDKVPVSMPHRTVAPPLPDTTINTIKNALAASGLNECWISSLVALDDLQGKGAFDSDNLPDDFRAMYSEATAVKVLNPLSDEHQVLRQSLIPGLLKALAYNQDHGAADAWLFETGLTYHRLPQQKGDRSSTATVEVAHVAGAISGQQTLSTWMGSAGNNGSGNGKERPTEFYLLKGIIENLLERLGIAESGVSFSVDAAPPWYHPSRSARVSFRKSPRDKESRTLGWLGEIHPMVADAYGLKRTACIFDFEVDALRSARLDRRFEEFYSTPVVVRDITADLPRATEQSAVRQLISQIGGKLLRKVELVSIFDLSAEQKSLSYRLTFQHEQQTLTAEEIDKLMNKMRDQLTRQLSASFRT
jgi:phenylalanyl-tRNA synthetase beta chain